MGERLKGRVAVVTGGSAGLGRALVRRFLAEGARVVSMQSSREGTESVAELGEGVVGVQGDVRSYADNRKAVESALETWGRLDVFVANAAVWDFSQSLEELPDDRVEAACAEVLSVNLTAPLLGAKAAAAALRESHGSLIFTVSNAGLYQGGGGPIYTASKHGVVGLIRQLAMELAPDVRVNGVAPGGMATALRGPAALDLEEARVEPGVLAEIFEQNASLAFLPKPEDYTGAFVWLASAEDAKATTGTVVNCDVGLSVRPLVR